MSTSGGLTRCSARLPLRSRARNGPLGLTLRSLHLSGLTLASPLTGAPIDSPPLNSLQELRLTDITVAPTHPSGCAWLGLATGLTRLCLLGSCPLVPSRLGLAHPALAHLASLRELLAPAWHLPREALPALATMSGLSRLEAATIASLPYAVRYPLPRLVSLAVGAWLGGSPLGGHLASQFPALTRLSAAGSLGGGSGGGGWDGGGGSGWGGGGSGGTSGGPGAEEGEGDQGGGWAVGWPPKLAPAACVALLGCGVGLGLGPGLYGAGNGAGGGPLGGPGLGAGANEGQLPQWPLPGGDGGGSDDSSDGEGGGGGGGGGLLGPTASSRRCRVQMAALPLDGSTCVRLHTYGTALRRLELTDGPAAALLEVMRPLKSLTSLTLRWASLPGAGSGRRGDDEDEDEEEDEASASRTDPDRGSDSPGVVWAERVCALLPGLGELGLEGVEGLVGAGGARCVGGARASQAQCQAAVAAAARSVWFELVWVP
ncbi:hypothetical protein HYH03_016989 [Edaphochlamys debaryana]|uniref:Uncharacterized protein n=1 Tax=Edaphochlamys debaryana TaxID=47281 RepID=A0A835XL00_9CHLO|nr:hypothetical protein HYH03_016989 [Edaphochlamys debaryana]|eukprot:KAG2484176.1 hypothetical protein HYH03_016989 [Edaphochlamys debaryana]